MANTPVSLDKIKIFADGASVPSILASAKNPRIAGFTTNPTLMRKANVADYRAFALDVLRAVPDRPVSFEVFSDDFPEMERQALEIASWAKNVYVKIPVTNTKRQSSVGLVVKPAMRGSFAEARIDGTLAPSAKILILPKKTGGFATHRPG